MDSKLISAHPTQTWPVSALIAVGVAILFLALFALEISDGLIRQHGVIAKSLFAWPPTAGLFAGMLLRKRWALFGARLASGLGAAWFFFIAGLAVVEQPVDQHGRVWIWILSVSVILGSIVLTAFFALGFPSTRRHYGLVCPMCGESATGLRAYFTKDPLCSACRRASAGNAPSIG